MDSPFGPTAANIFKRFFKYQITSYKNPIHKKKCLPYINAFFILTNNDKKVFSLNYFAHLSDL